MSTPLKYFPDTSINVNAGPIRDFNEHYPKLYQEIVESMKEHQLDGLTAIQIGHPYQLMVIKEEEAYIAYANPRIITQENPFQTLEKSSYFNHVPIPVTRYRTLSIIYEDAKGEMQTKKIDNEAQASLFQRKIDYLFNTTLIDRLPPHQKDKVVKALKGKGSIPSLEEVTQVVPKQPKSLFLLSVTDKLLFFMLLSLFLPLFHLSKETLQGWYAYDTIAFFMVLLLMGGYFFMTQYEAKRFNHCTACQVGSSIGTIVKRVLLALGCFVGAYVVVNPL
jgi:peptide deformylase